MDYDVIGDIHGHAHALRALLLNLGYRERNGAWRHPSRQALFVGDYIDRGPAQVETVDVVRRMVDGGSAQAVMGNHEFNAIAWATPDPELPGEFLRPRLGERGLSNRVQHERFLEEMGDPEIHRDLIDWFLTLPLWLDLPEVRLVHACWHEGYMTELSPLLAPGNRLTRELMVAASRPDHMEFRAAEGLTKGMEVPLPDGHTFVDKDGRERREVRVRWWDAQATSYRALALMPESDLQRVPDIPVPEAARIGYQGAKPVFFGHYWMQGRPAPVGPNAACVDYSIGKQGKLVAYRLDAGEPLSDDRFTWVGA